jgi:hypothetical protein
MFNFKTLPLFSFLFSSVASPSFFLFPLIFFSHPARRPLFLSLSFFLFSGRRRPFTLSMSLSVIFFLTHSLLRRSARHTLSGRPFSPKQWTRSPLSSVPNYLREIAGAMILLRISARSLLPSRLISNRY